ncbi:MAG: hypothetical protein FDZ70_06140 [Actinobacteria bacterium]|nr:MAG: hypothetical protein FDZ70_06140 [Actinomycetota bacterium]
MLKKLLGWGIVIAIVATVINDGGRFFSGWRVAEDAAIQAATDGATAGRGEGGRRKAWVAIYNSAARLGAVAENVDMGDSGVTAYVRYDVTGTWVVAPVIQMSNGVWDVKTWWTTPIAVRAKGRSMY